MPANRGSIMMLVSKYRRAGGRENVINNLSVHLSRIGYDLSIGARSFETDPPPEITKINMTELRNIVTMNRTQSPQIIDSHQTLSNYFAFIIKKPFLFHYHGAADRLQEINLKICFSFLEKQIPQIVSVSNWASENLRRITAQSSKVIYNGVDNNLFRPSLGTAYRRGEPQLLFVGNLYPHKGVEKLIIMLPQLLERFPNSHLAIIGSGAHYSKLQTTIDKMNIQRSVQLVGNVPLSHLPLYYCSCDVYVSASSFETFDLPALEAMACGKPILLSNIPPHKEIVQASKAGDTFSLGNDESFITSFDRIYQKRNILGNSGKDFAEQNDWSIVANRHSAIYDQIISQFDNTRKIR